MLRVATAARRGPPDPPYGWFALAFSDELPRGAVVPRTLAGRELVLFRTQQGQAVALDAYCPHLGAHMGHGGTVDGETVRCPFHGFCFDRSGACVKTGYSKRPPVKARVEPHHLREVAGAVFVWFHPDNAPPLFEPPTVDMSGFTRMRTHLFPMRGHPQETTENAADIGHLSVVHGYEAVALSSSVADGPHLHVRASFERRGGILPVRVVANVRVEIEIHAWGLGLSYVEVLMPQLGLETRQYIFSTPTALDRIDLRVGMQMRVEPSRLSAPLRALARRALDRVAMPFAIEAFKGDVGQDFAIWNHKRYVHPPVLADGDGPIMKYRGWASQFYPDSGAGAARAPGTEA